MKTSIVCPKLTAVVIAVLLISAAPALSESKPASSSGKSLFTSHCVMCHGSDGTANTTMGNQLKAANLRSKEVHKLTESEIQTAFLSGKGNMPPFDGLVTAAEARQIAHYVHSFKEMK